jgi:hypothetical protein
MHLVPCISRPGRGRRSLAPHGQIEQRVYGGVVVGHWQQIDAEMNLTSALLSRQPGGREVHARLADLIASPAL